MKLQKFLRNSVKTIDHKTFLEYIISEERNGLLDMLYKTYVLKTYRNLPDISDHEVANLLKIMDYYPK